MTDPKPLSAEELKLIKSDTPFLGESRRRLLATIDERDRQIAEAWKEARAAGETVGISADYLGALICGIGDKVAEIIDERDTAIAELTEAKDRLNPEWREKGFTLKSLVTENIESWYLKAESEAAAIAQRDRQIAGKEALLERDRVVIDKTESERDAAIEQRDRLEKALRALKEDYADSEGCYCGQLIGGTNSEGEPLGLCGFCLAHEALAPKPEDDQEAHG